MTDREIEQRLASTVEMVTPDVLDGIMAACGAQPEAQVTPISSAKKRSLFPRIAAVAAMLVLIVAASFALGRFTAGGSVASIVSLDVNPSIELRLDDKAIVLGATAMNPDAQEVLEGIPLEGAHVNTAVSAVIGSLLSHGYIDELANSILISVEDSDAARGERLSAEITQDINETLAAASVNASILSQYISGAEVDSLSQEYGISHGKAALINEILEANPTYSFAELSALSVNDLNLILSNPKNSVDGVTSTGSASSGAYIGTEAALAASIADAGLTADQLSKIEVEFDFDNGLMVYDVEFDYGRTEYEYKIDALTAAIVERPYFTGNQVETPAPSGGVDGDIGYEAARDIALNHAGFAAGDVRELEVEADYDDGRLEYSVEFKSGYMEYEYEIDGTTGAIIEYDVDYD